ncbi:uncharacterized protein LOC120257623 [Dioscorea cayenensis subsp. rotundata]|uniref:Uncharacterized protein LOC120257623 n=1 Tax=Dioscorea cayennensis subsp. rotundata TaxID=55577 RepID=A0AB40B2J3_DIOCR|nr:uncharacterized protein LOC120257623 [Dioscorea cayenensis subsp. rotundata]
MDAGPAVVDRVVIMKSAIGVRCHDAKTLAEKGKRDGSGTRHSLFKSLCPEGTVPIGRTTEEDILRASSIRRFGRETISRVHCDSTASGHEHLVGYVMGEQYYGAKYGLNVWAPRVASSSKFSLSQIWVIFGSFGDDLNTIEAGWQISPQLYGDNSPRFFTYWTTDAYQATGCYNHIIVNNHINNDMIFSLHLLVLDASSDQQIPHGNNHSPESSHQANLNASSDAF